MALHGRGTNAALTRARPPGMADTLKTGNYTVFAPTDAAFAKLPAGCGARAPFRDREPRSPRSLWRSPAAPPPLAAPSTAC